MDEFARWLINTPIALGGPAIAAAIAVGWARNIKGMDALIQGASIAAAPAGEAIGKFSKRKRDTSAAGVAMAGNRHRRDQVQLNRALDSQGRKFAGVRRGWGKATGAGRAVKGTVGGTVAGAQSGGVKGALGGAWGGVRGATSGMGRNKQAARDYLASHHTEGVMKELEGLNAEYAQAVDKYGGDVEKATNHLAELHPKEDRTKIAASVAATAADMRGRGISLGTDSTKRALMNYGASTGTMLSGTGKEGQQGYFDHVEQTYGNQARAGGYVLSARIAAGGQGYTQARPQQLVVEKEGKTNLTTMHTAVNDAMSKMSTDEQKAYIENIAAQVGQLGEQWKGKPGAYAKAQALETAHKNLQDVAAQHGLADAYNAAHTEAAGKVKTDEVHLHR